MLPARGKAPTSTSHVINKDRFVSGIDNRKVEAAIKSSNYASPSALARSLAKPDPHDWYADKCQYQPFIPNWCAALESEATERGYSLVLCNTEGDEQRMNRNPGDPDAKRVDGLSAAVYRNASAFVKSWSVIRLILYPPRRWTGRRLMVVR